MSATRMPSFATIVITIVVAIAVLGCGAATVPSPSAAVPSNDGGSAPPSEASPAASEAPRDTVDIVAVFPGDAPADWDTVLAAVNDKLLADNVGVRLRIDWTPWADYGNATLLKVTAGEQLDAFLDAPWLHINQLIADGSLAQLDDLVANAPNLQATIPKSMWDANRFGGKIYGIPVGFAQGDISGFYVRKDLREIYGLPPIETIADLEAFLYAVKENEADIVPYAAVGESDRAMIVLNDAYWNAQPQSAPPGQLAGVQYLGGEQGAPKVIPFWDTPGFAGVIERSRKWLSDGIVNENAVLNPNTATDAKLFYEGKYAVLYGQAAEVTYATPGIVQLEATVPGAKVEFVAPFASSDAKPITEFKQANFLTIPTNSPNAERVVALMDWLSIRENHDLLTYGIAGTHWEPVGTDQYATVEGSSYAFYGFLMSWRPGLERMPEATVSEMQDWYRKIGDPSAFTPSIYAGFSFDAAPVSDQVGQISPLWSQFVRPLTTGALDPATGIDEMKAAYMGAGYQAVLDEAQKQVDQFIGSQ